MTIALVALGAMVLAVLAILLAYLASQLMTKLLQAMPSIGVLGVTLLSPLRKLVQHTADSMAALMKASMGPLAALFGYLWYMHAQSNQHAQKHAAHSNARMHQIVHADIPNAKATAIRWAAINAYEAQVQSQRYAHSQVQSLAHTVNADNAKLHAGIQDVHAQAKSLSAHAQYAAEVYAATQAAKLHERLDQLRYDTQAKLTEVVNSTDASLQALRAETAYELHKANDYTASVGHAAATIGADAAAQAQVHSEQWANASSAVGASVAWPVVQPRVNGIAGWLGTTFPDAAGGLNTLPTVMPETLAGVIAALSAATAVTATAVDECVVPMCSANKTFLRQLQGLLGLFASGSLLELLIEMVTHPTAVSEEISTVTTDTVTPVIDAIKALF